MERIVVRNERTTGTRLLLFPRLQWLKSVFYNNCDVKVSTLQIYLRVHVLFTSEHEVVGRNTHCTHTRTQYVGMTKCFSYSLGIAASPFHELITELCRARMTLTSLGRFRYLFAIPGGFLGLNYRPPAVTSVRMGSQADKKAF